MVSSDWLPIIEHILRGSPDSSVGFLVLDYPGYGSNAGAPSSPLALRCTEAGVEAALRSLRAGESNSASALPSLAFFGHSLGAAAAAQAAAALARRPPPWLGSTAVRRL